MVKKIELNTQLIHSMICSAWSNFYLSPNFSWWWSSINNFWFFALKLEPIQDIHSNIEHQLSYAEIHWSQKKLFLWTNNIFSENETFIKKFDTICSSLLSIIPNLKLDRNFSQFNYLEKKISQTSTGQFKTWQILVIFSWCQS
jgi:hypothetical protein